MRRLLGVDVGGSSLKAVVTDPAGAVESRIGPEPLRQGDGRLDGVVGRVIELADLHRVGSIGVGLAGLVDRAAGRFVWGPHVPGGPVDLAGRLLASTGRPSVIENDATCATLAEWRRGVLRGRRHAALVAIGTGIGAGFVLDGRLYRGRAFAGEAGHVRAPGGTEPCACGRIGCWETLVSGSRLDREARRLIGPDAGGPELVAAAVAGDAAALTVLEDMGTALGAGIVSLVLLLDLEVVAVGGAVAAAGDLLLGPARAAIASDLAGASHRPPVELVAAGLGAWAGAVGAALLAEAAAEREDV